MIDAIAVLRGPCIGVLLQVQCFVDAIAAFQRLRRQAWLRVGQNPHSVLDWSRLQELARSRFSLGEHSVHFWPHWQRVEAYGVHLARCGGGDLEVVRLFAWLHDCLRYSEGHDPEHGRRAAELARQLQGDWIELEPARLELLAEACADHDRGWTSTDPTIGACWDSDRLDLDRVGIVPSLPFFSTEEGRRLALLSPAQRRRAVLDSARRETENDA